MTGIDAVQAVMEEFAPDTPKRRTLQERRAMLAKGKRYACHPKPCPSRGMLLSCQMTGSQWYCDLDSCQD